MMFTSYSPLDETGETESHDLDQATCMWLLAMEQMGRMLVLAPERVVLPVSYVVAGDNVVVRADGDACSAACPTGSPVAFDVDAFDVFSQVGWSVHVRGAIEGVVEAERADPSLQRRLRAWTRQPDGQWLRISVRDVRGRWFRPPEHSRVFATTGYI
jgi:hypothetical protein